MRTAWTAFAGLCLAISMTACTAALSRLVHGGTVLPKGSPLPNTVLVSYRAEGVNVPRDTAYYLVEGPQGLAILERNVKNGSGTLIEAHWQDQEGDHFAAAVPNAASFEYVVPIDRSKEAQRFVYKRRFRWKRGENVPMWQARNKDARVLAGRLVPAAAGP
jgi:hypothetical protein